MNIVTTCMPSEIQLEELRSLAKYCRIHDNIRLSYPAEENGNGCRHFLLYEEDGTLAAALALIEINEDFSECSAFTHPTYRKRGYFSLLLDYALEEWEKFDILFAVCENCPDTMAVLKSLGAELDFREHQMEFDFSSHKTPTQEDMAFPRRHPDLVVSSRHDAGAWVLLEHGHIIGHCMATPVSDGCACLHHVEIDEGLRGQGYGTDFMALLLPRLAASGYRKVILQVSGSNTAALSLYNKTGFRITETLSYYWY